MGKKVATDAPVNKPSDYCKYEGHEVWWSADPKGKAILQHAETGLASIDPKKGVPFMTIPQLFQKAVKRYPKQVALRSEQMGPLAKGQTAPPPTPLSEWKSWSWRQYYDDSCAAAKAFISLGLEPHDSVNIFGFNSPEWLMSQMGAMLAGGKAAGIYPTDTPDQVQFKSDHSNGAIACLENEGCLEKFKQVANQLPWLKCIVTWACEPGDDIKTADGRTIKTISWEEMIKLGKSLPDEPLNERIKNQDPGHACALIYTSGTTGNPKAVMITHDNMIYTACAAMLLPGVMGVKEGEERIISYLPLSHVAGMMIDVISPIIVTSGVAGFKGWHNTNFARPYDLKIGTLVDRLQTIRPTIFLGVPRVWEKIMEKMKSVGASSKGLKKALADYSKKRAAVYTSSRQLGGTGTTPNMLLANLVLGAVKKKLGLNKCKFYFSGAAPMTQECLEYFGALNFNINEVYGMSESTGGATWSTDKHHVWGAVGHEYTGVEVRVFKKAEDGGDDFSNVVECPPAENLFASTEEQQGEICFRGRIIMLGYMANPRLGKEHVDEIEQKNRDAIDKNGFMHSGDKGTRDIHGMIKITGRYKELIIGAGGENIAPVPIEDEIKRVCPLISNVMMIGNKRKYNVCILTLKAVGASGELPGSDKLAPPASTFSPKSKTISEAMNDESIIKAITQAITDVNKNEKVVPSNAAKIQKFTILPRDFSVVTGELTATLKLKRAVAESEFTPIIDKMYQSKDDYVNYNLAPTPGLDMGTPKEGAVVEEERPEKDLSFNMIKEVEDAGAVLEAGGDDKDAKLDE